MTSHIMGLPQEDLDQNLIIPVGSQRKLSCHLGKAAFVVESQDAHIHIFGQLFYWADPDFEKVSFIGPGDVDVLRKKFGTEPLKEIVNRLEGQYVGVRVAKKGGEITVFCDRYSRKDIFYALDKNDLFISTDLEFIFRHVSPQRDPFMAAHLFGVYGWYTPKGTTIYKNVKQLKVGEILTFSDKGLTAEQLPFEPFRIGEGGSEDLERYYRALRDSVVARARACGQKTLWVSSSSGWDSSMLLGLLVDEFGAANVRMMAGSMSYSPATGTINKFEMDKINRIGAFYGIKPDVVEFDLSSSKAPAYWQSKAAHLRARHMYTLSSYNFSKISDAIAAVEGAGRAVFNGETSDSFHNFGFSQFVTFFHTVKSFTEYGDKMNCYLYGPTFFRKVLDGKYESDKVFQIFQKMYNIDLQKEFSSQTDMLQRYLYPLFYGGARVPFSRNYRNPALREKTQEDLLRYPFGTYLPGVLRDLTPETLYAWMIYLYHSFHSQGSTVGIHKHAMEMNGHACLSPFNDYRVIRSLSQAPESWGRGLDFNHTKHPLKWVARQKIKFPYGILEEGPHSYLYDVIEGFSLFAEILYRSGLTPYFKDVLAQRRVLELLPDDHFDAGYLDKLITQYLDNKPATGQDFNNLVTLLTLSVTEWY